MKKTLLLFFISFLSLGFSRAQNVSLIVEEPDSSNWEITGAGNVSFANVALSNWAGGGESSISLGFVGKLMAVYETDKVFGKMKWT